MINTDEDLTLVAVSTDNIVLNSSFSSGAQSIDMHNLLWWRDPAVDVAQGWDEIVAASGLTDAANAPAEFAGKFILLADDTAFAFANNQSAIPVLPGETYRFQCEVNDNGSSSNANFRMYITWHDETLAFHSLKLVTQTPVSVWTSIIAEAVVPSGARYMRLSCAAADPGPSPTGEWYATAFKAFRLPNIRTEVADFEEGTFIPTIQDTSKSDAEGQTYFAQAGFYTKIGNRVFFNLRVAITSLGSMTGSDSAFVANLPFTSSSTSSSHSAVSVGFGTSLAITAGVSVTGRINPGTDEIILTVWELVTGVTKMTPAKISAGGDLIISGHYIV